ncbi:hypothetical protein LAN29_23730, partial [Mycobacterium tuberculosis]|nr:hypothetical protein [Mycobacterium tuberculosis]
SPVTTTFVAARSALSSKTVGHMGVGAVGPESPSRPASTPEDTGGFRPGGDWPGEWAGGA